MLVTPPGRRRGIPELDAIRGIAASAVALWHWTSMARIPDPIFQSFSAALYRSSEIAVTVFFVLSGAVLTLSLKNGGDGSLVSNIISYYIRRFFRIFPLLFVVVTFAYVEMLLLRQALGIETKWGSYSDFSFSSWIKAVFLIETKILNPPGWTLRVEVVAYLLMPFVILIFTRNKIKPIVISLTSIIIISVIVVKLWLPWSSFYLLMPMFVPGVALGFIIDSPEFRKLPSFPVLLVGVLGAGILINIEEKHYEMSFLVATSWAALMSWTLLENGAVRRVVNSKPLSWLGDISYGVFLWHYPLLWIWFYLFGGFVGTKDWWLWIACGAVGLPLTLLFSHLGYKYIERPMMNFAATLAKTGRGPASAVLRTSP